MIQLHSVGDIDLLAETEELECKLASGRDGQGQLPQDFWPTYSAFANTHGGLILLGLKQNERRFELAGLKNAEKVRTDLFNQLNNPQKVSGNVLSATDVQILEIDGYKLLAVEIPKASRKFRPVYINGNPLTGTYRRLDEGDRLCDAIAVKAMLAEQVDDSRDNRLLKGFGAVDLNGESILAYRQAMRDRTPNHPFLDDHDAGFLQKIGALGVDRENGQMHATAAGLLMFGEASIICEEFPNYHLDYQERPRAQTELRWVDRVTLDGTWSGNIFDFYRRVYRKLVAELKVPFALQDGRRQDETPVHQALREALVNSLAHADYTARASVLVVKRPDMFGFRNPGMMRVSITQALAGGESDGRNRTIQRMFLLIGAGEKAGSGVPKIHKGWKEQHWTPPSLYDLDEPSEQTRLELRMNDLIPAEAMEKLRYQFGGRLENLSADERLILATAATEQVVTHARMLTICEQHRVDLSRMLQGLVQNGLLEQTGRSRAAVYRLPGTSLPSPESVFGPGETNRGAIAPTAFRPLELALKPSDLDSEGLNISSAGLKIENKPADRLFGVKVPGLETLLIGDLSELDQGYRTQLQLIAAEVSEKGKVPTSLTQTAIELLCDRRFLTIKVLSELLGRNETYLRQSILNPMVREKRLRRAFPQSPNHPRQAYITADDMGPKSL